MDIKLIVAVALALLVGAFLLLAPGKGPQGELVIAQGGANQIAVMNAGSGRLTSIPAGPVVHGVGVSPDGKVAYAASFGSNEVFALDLKARKMIAKIDVGGKAHHITVCPHGKHVFATVGETNSIAVIDTNTNTVIAQIPVEKAPSYAVLTPDEKLYVTNMGSNTVSVIDPAQMKVVATIEVGQSPDHAAVAPDGKSVYVTNKDANSVSVIDASTQQVLATVPVGKGPHGVAATEKYVYVGNRGETTLSLIDIATNRVVQTIELGTKPEHLIVAGKYLYIGSVEAKSILILDTATNRVVKKIKVGSEVHQIAVVGAPAAHDHATAPLSKPTRALTEAELTRTSKEAGIDVSVVFLNPLMEPEESEDQLHFRITLDTHAGDLMQYDLTKLAVLRTSAGVSVQSGFVWEPSSESSHHRTGILKIPATHDRVSLLTAQSLELELKDIGVPSRVFRWELTPTSERSAVSSQVLAILEQVHHEIIPAEDTPTPYGINFSTAGYETLLKHQQEMNVPMGKEASFEELDMALPCCGFQRASASDERQNCSCGHHLALYGLGKHLLSLGYTTAQVQQEINRWHHYFYPKESLRAEMERRAKLDPVIEAALKELKAKGQC